MILSLDHYGVQDREKLQSLYDKHYTALSDLLERTHNTSEHINKISVYLPYLKSLSFQHSKALSDFKTSSKAPLDFTALHRELFASTALF